MDDDLDLIFDELDGPLEAGEIPLLDDEAHEYMDTEMFSLMAAQRQQIIPTYYAPTVSERIEALSSEG